MQISANNTRKHQREVVKDVTALCYGSYLRNLHIYSCIPNEKYKYINGFGQGQKFLSDPGVLTLWSTCSYLTLVLMDVA